MEIAAAVTGRIGVAVAEGVAGAGLLFRLLGAEQESSWLPESATERIDSASIDEDAVSRNATNFMTAMDKLAVSAAIIALLPALADMDMAPGLGTVPPLCVRVSLQCSPAGG